MRLFDIGLSAIRVNQRELDVLGNNLANAATPSYHRKRADRVTRPPLMSDPLRVGRGVDLQHISRLRNAAVENALLRNASLLSTSRGALDTAGQVENVFAPADGAMHEHLSEFFSRAEAVANSPRDLTVRREFLASASRLSSAFQDADQRLTELRNDLVAELQQSVQAVNDLTVELAEVNRTIRDAMAVGSPPNDLLDRRDQLHLELAEYLDVNVVTASDGNDVIMVAGGSVMAGYHPPEFRLDTGGSGTWQLELEPQGTPLPIGGGRIAALLDSVNSVIPDARNELTRVASELMQSVDQQHATGLSDSGGWSLLRGSRPVDDINRPLTENGNTGLPVSNGSLYVTVTDLSTGVRRTERIDVDPDTDSLTDLASRIDAIPDLAAFVDPVRRTLTIDARTGFEFDFAGRPDNVPDLSGFAGTATPAIGGRYTGPSNDTWTITFSGAGTVGVTDGLTATVRDSGGQILQELNVGRGYSAGADLEILSGVSVQFAPGTVNATDTVSLQVIANSDTGQLLSALGLNSFFTGTDAATIDVRSGLTAAPQTLAVSVSGEPGDAGNLARVSDLRDLRSTTLDDRTFVEFLSDLTAESGLGVTVARARTEHLSALEEKLIADRAAVSGVDVNEEMLAMMELERGFQAIARYITTIDRTLEELFAIAV